MYDSKGVGEAGLTTFEVTVESEEACSVGLRILVQATNWVEAWRQGLRVMGDDVPFGDARCVMEGDDIVRVEAPTLKRIFFIRPVGADEALPGPRPTEGTATLVTTLLDASIPILRTMRVHTDPTSAPQRRPIARRPPDADVAVGPGLPVSETLDRVSAAAPDPVADRPRLETDPIVRVLSELEQARLAARPVRIDTASGLPVAIDFRATPTRPSVRPDGHATRMGLVAAGSDGARAASTRQETEPYIAVAASELLPQEFRPVTTDHPTKDDPITTLDEAIETASQHIGCQIGQVLRYYDAATLEVVAARGEHRRETLTCRINADTAFNLLSSGRPGRVKFGENPQHLHYSAAGREVFEVEVTSALTAPIEVDGARWGVVMLLNAPRESGFADGELRALSYLGKTLGRALTQAT